MAAFTAGFFMACTVSPFDMVRWVLFEPYFICFLGFVFPLENNNCSIDSHLVVLYFTPMLLILFSPSHSFFARQVRTRLMNQPPDAKIYKNFLDCFIKVSFDAAVLLFPFPLSLFILAFL